MRAYRKEGAQDLAHGNRGRQPVNALSQQTRGEIVRLVESRYRDVNHCHLTELLAEREGLQVSRSTIRRVLGGAGGRRSTALDGSVMRRKRCCCR